MNTYRKRLLAPFSAHAFLLGPRGTGKTLWSKASYPDAVRVDLLDPDTFRLFAARPEQLLALARAIQPGEVIVVDEVQKLPQLLEVAHLSISEGMLGTYLFTGSSARKLRRGDVNLLGGRAQIRMMYPYLAIELGHDFSLDRSLQYGMVPVVVEATDPQAARRAYNALYVHEEVYAEGLVRRTDAFARFLEAISFSHGQVVNVANVSRECAVPRKTVESYLQILEDTYLAFKVQVFRQRAQRELAQHPKFYFFDVGVFRANRPTGPLYSTADVEGAALEGLVLQHLVALAGLRQDGTSVSYWRTRSGVEVDAIVYGPSTFWAIEVKRSKEVRPEHLRGLKAFVSDYPEATPILLYGGTDRMVVDGIAIEPVEGWLRSLGSEFIEAPGA